MAEINWTEEAQRWLRDIFNYIALDNPDAARKVVAENFEKAQPLKSFQEICYKYRTEPESDIRIPFGKIIQASYFFISYRIFWGALIMGMPHECLPHTGLWIKGDINEQD